MRKNGQKAKNLKNFTKWFLKKDEGRAKDGNPCV